MEAVLKSGAPARRLRVTVKTLKRCDRSGLFMPLTRSPTGLLLYSESQLAARLRLPPPTAWPRTVGSPAPPRDRACATTAASSTRH